MDPGLSSQPPEEVGLCTLGIREVAPFVCLCVLRCASVKPDQGLPLVGWAVSFCALLISRKVPVIVGQQTGAWIPADPHCHWEAGKADSLSVVRPCP